MFPAILTAICFALTAVCARQAASLIGVVQANMFRLLIAVVLLGIITCSFWGNMPTLSMVQFAVAGGIGFGLGGYCMMQALKRLGSPQSLLTTESCTAMLAAILTWVSLNDTLTRHEIIACCVILCGVLYAGSFWIEDTVWENKRTSIQGYALAVSASFFQAISLVISRHAFLEAARAELGINMFQAAFFRLLGGLAVALVLFLALFLVSRKPKDSGTSSVPKLFAKGKSVKDQPLIWVSANALMGPVLGVTCWLWAVSQLNPGIVQSIAATATLISIPASRLLESRKLGIRYFIGAPVAILGVAALKLW